ncbi:hypothetical protein OIU79_007884, partial [Salix purpurea]
MIWNLLLTRLFFFSGVGENKGFVVCKKKMAI